MNRLNLLIYCSPVQALLMFCLALLLPVVNAQESVDHFEITSPVSGVIKAVHVQVGKTVKAGELLLEYDDKLIKSDLAEAKAVMELARINIQEAKKELERAEELYDRTVLSEHDLQLAKIQYSQAVAKHARDKNQLIHAQWHVDHSKLYAPFSGKIIQIFSYPGQYVNNQMMAQKLMIIEKTK